MLLSIMVLMYLIKVRSPGLGPKSSRTVIYNSCSCLVHMSPISKTAHQPSRIGSVHIAGFTGTVLRLLVDSLVLFSHQVSSFLNRFESVIFASK